MTRQYMNNKLINQTTQEQTAREMLEQGFAKYREELDKGDHREIATRSKESIRNVREYIGNLNISSVKTGLKIFAAMQALIMERRKAVEKLVA